MDLALDVEDLMFARIRKFYRKKTEEIHPNQDDSLLNKFRNFLLPADKEEGKKKSKIGDLRPPLVSYTNLPTNFLLHKINNISNICSYS